MTVARRAGLVVLASAALVVPTALAAAAPAAVSAAAPRSRLYGVTVDTVHHLADTVAAIKHLPHRQTVRVVMDVYWGHPTDMSWYDRPVHTLAGAADVMAELVDSSDLTHISPTGVRARARTAVREFGDDVSLWEIGNEVNGNWTGKRSVVARKVAAAYSVVHRAGDRTALTLFYNHDCGDGPNELDPIAWSKRYLSKSVRSGLDDVLLSYYEVSCGGRRPSVSEWTAYFRKLHRLFPNAKLGFGEIGLAKPATAATKQRAQSLIRYYYRLPVDLPYYVGGCFWWYFAEDMVPYRRSPLWHSLARATG